MWNARRPKFSVVRTGWRREARDLDVDGHEAVLAAKNDNVRSVRDRSAGFTESKQGLSEISQKMLEVG